MAVNNPFDEHDASSQIGARQFHQLTNRNEIIDIIDSYDLQFLDVKNGMLKESLAKWRNCPVCTNNDYEVSFVKKGFRYCRCRHCNMLYVNPILHEHTSLDAYQYGEVSNKVLEVLLSKTQREFDQPKFLKALELIEEITPATSGRRLLDVGCSVGHFLEVARSLKWNGMGIELNEAAADHAESKGFQVIRRPLVVGLFPAESFDVVTMWDVLEHIPDPEYILGVIEEILAPDGLFCLIVPNADALAARIMREKCTMFRGSSHVNIFNRHTLSSLMERLGFECRNMISLIGEINVINNWLSYQDPYRGDSIEKKSVLNLINEKTMHENFLGYKLFCIGTKKNKR